MAGTMALIVGFGYGKKTDLYFGKHPHNETPPSNSYNIPTFVDTNKLHHKGFTPRNSREVTIKPSRKSHP